MLASRNGHSEIAKYLIEAKALLDLQKQAYYALNADEDDILYIKVLMIVNCCIYVTKHVLLSRHR